MSEFNFKSQPYTTIEQSQRLIALGLKVETADCCHWFCISCVDEPIEGENIPAWSLGRLLALGNGEDWNAEITLKDERYGIHTGFDTMWYDDIFEAVIAWIEEDIKEGYFNKEYLEE